jgi:transcriptional regulator with PAS, ATPase and Fis domain
VDNSIAIIVSNKKISETCEMVVKNLGYDYPVYHSSTSDALKLAEELVENGTKIILSMGYTANYIKRIKKVLVLELQYTGLEFIEAIKKGFVYSDKIAVIGSQSLTYLMLKAINSLEKPVKVFNIKEDEPIEEQAQKILEMGYEVIISGSPSVDIANENEKIGITPDIEEKMVKETLNSARYILKLLNETKKESHTLQTILNCTSEGIIGTNRNDNITFINPTAEKLLPISMKKAINKNIEEIFKENNIVNVLNSEFNEKDNCNKKNFVINKEPITVDGNVNGAVYTLKKVTEIQLIEQKIRKKILLKGHYAKKTFNDIIGDSVKIKKAKKTALKYSKYDSTVLITGETGTGKEIFAQSIHNASRRNKGPFVAVNCAALPANLLESELFGYVSGAFTGARQNGKIGMFEMAHNGTIFLDEISEIPIDMQARLLRVLQEHEIVKIGDDKVIPVDVRVIAATNKNLLNLVGNGKFRDDLYYRLCVLELNVPPLRERKEDISELSKSIINKNNIKLKMKIKGLSKKLEKAFISFEWKGNVRQLENLIEKLMVLSDSEYLDIMLLEETVPYLLDDVQKSNSNSLEYTEKKKIDEVLVQTNGNKKEAAKILGISKSTLWRKLNK